MLHATLKKTTNFIFFDVACNIFDAENRILRKLHRGASHKEFCCNSFKSNQSESAILCIINIRFDVFLV